MVIKIPKGERRFRHDPSGRLVRARIHRIIQGSVESAAAERARGSDPDPLPSATHVGADRKVASASVVFLVVLRTAGTALRTLRVSSLVGVGLHRRARD
jgi:hypothetical protein